METKYNPLENNFIKINELENFTNFEELIIKHTNVQSVNEVEDIEAFKAIIWGVNNGKISPSLDFKIISLIISHLSDTRCSYVDRGCFLATAFYKVDHFNASDRASFEEFKHLLNVEKRIIETSDPNEIINNYDLREDYKRANVYDCELNIMYYQNAVKILKSSDNRIEIESVYTDFENILNRTSQRTLDIYSEEMFTVLTKLTTSKHIYEQFKCLVMFLSKNFKYYDNALSLFRNTKIESLQAYLLYTFEYLADIVDIDKKETVYLKFTQSIIQGENIQCSEIIENHTNAFIKKNNNV